ncbi:unnamed protein product [Parajaminaea phylloscopi]
MAARLDTKRSKNLRRNAQPEPVLAQQTRTQEPGRQPRQPPRDGPPDPASKSHRGGVPSSTTKAFLPVVSLLPQQSARGHDVGLSLLRGNDDDKSTGMHRTSYNLRSVKTESRSTSANFTVSFVQPEGPAQHAFKQHSAYPSFRDATQVDVNRKGNPHGSSNAGSTQSLSHTTWDEPVESSFQNALLEVRSDADRQRDTGSGSVADGSSKGTALEGACKQRRLRDSDSNTSPLEEDDDDDDEGYMEVRRKGWASPPWHHVDYADPNMRRLRPVPQTSDYSNPFLQSSQHAQSQSGKGLHSIARFQDMGQQQWTQTSSRLHCRSSSSRADLEQDETLPSVSERGRQWCSVAMRVLVVPLGASGLTWPNFAIVPFPRATGAERCDLS